jgi:hypothetical protein
MPSGADPAGPKPLGANAQAAARNLYVGEYLPAKAVAARLGVAERTVQRWMAADASKCRDWNEARRRAAQMRSTQEAAAQEFMAGFLTFQRKVLAELDAAADMAAAEKTKAIASLSDSFAKTARATAVAVAAPETTQLAIAMDTLQKLARFVAETHQDAAPLLAEALEAFAETLMT